MEYMTEMTDIMFQRAMNARSIREATEVLLHTGQFRSLWDILVSFSGEENPRGMLVKGLQRWNPGIGRESVDKKVRNWMGGRTKTVSKQDAYILSRVLNLSLKRTDEFLKLVTEEGIHWRSPEEIAWCYAIWNNLEPKDALELVAAAAEAGKHSGRKEPSQTGNHTDIVRREVEAMTGGSPEELLAYIAEQRDKLDGYHNTAHWMFMGTLKLLEQGSEEDLEEPKKKKDREDTPRKLSSREVLETYLHRKLVPVAKRGEAKSAFSDVQRSIRANWPDEVTLSKMRTREVDVTRKVLILLFLATDCAFVYGQQDETKDIDYTREDWEEMDWEEEAPLTRDEMFEAACTRMNTLLSTCGYCMLDPRNPFDWMVLFCLCVDDIFEVDDRLKGMLASAFPDGNEN